MSSESSVSDDFRPLIQLASDVLQDAVGLAGIATMGNERIRIRSENITSKLISMISLLSQISIEHANKLKQYRRIERKSMKYIEELRNCVINQGMEIQQLQAQISSQHSSAKASCVMQVDAATNTDGPTTEFLVSSMKARFEEESSKLLDEISMLKKTNANLNNATRVLQKDLNKANMMLQTQQIFLEECEDKRYLHPLVDDNYDRVSRKKGSRLRDNTFDQDSDTNYCIQPPTNIHKLKIKAPQQSDVLHHFSQGGTLHQLDAVHRAVSTLSLRSDSNQGEISENNENVDLSSPGKIQNAASSRYGQQLDSSIDFEKDNEDEEIVLATSHSPNPTIKNSEDKELSSSIVSAEPSSFSYNFDNNNSSTVDEITELENDVNGMDRPRDEKYGGDFNNSQDSFALIADYYDDYFRENASKYDVTSNPQFQAENEEDDDQ